MGRQVLTVISPKGPYPGTVAADGLDFVWTAADVTNFDSFAFTGRELVMANNTGASPYTITLESVADAQGRLGDVTTYSMAAGDFSAFWAGNRAGWDQGTGLFHLKASNVAVKWAIMRIPG